MSNKTMLYFAIAAVALFFIYPMWKKTTDLVPLLDANGKAVLDSNGDPVMVPKKKA